MFAGVNMFGFGRKRRYRKAAGKVGVLIHGQILDALASHKKLFQKSEEVAFTSGYLKSFFWSVLNRHGCNDMTLQLRLLRSTCDKVSPGRLWEIYQSGAELADPLTKSYKPGCMNAYELGVTAGLNDAEEGAAANVTPVNLTRYLLGKRLLGPAFTEEDILQLKAAQVAADANLKAKSKEVFSVPD